MKAVESRAAFESLIHKRGCVQNRLTAREALELAVQFYTNVRAVDCDIANDGDMLLYQWGIYSLDGVRKFGFDITRQFIISNGEDDMIYQLSVVMKFPLDEAAFAIGTGNKWCGSPDDVAEFQQFVVGSSAFRFANENPSESVNIIFDLAG